MISSLVPADSKNMIASMLQVLLTKKGIDLEQELARICPVGQAEEQAVTLGLDSLIALSRHNMNLQFMGYYCMICVLQISSRVNGYYLFTCQLFNFNHPWVGDFTCVYYEVGTGYNLVSFELNSRFTVYHPWVGDLKCPGLVTGCVVHLKFNFLVLSS